MSPRRLILSAVMALALSLSVTSLAAQSKDRLPAAVGDLTAAQLIEVRDQAGQVLLNGTFTTSKNTAKETERTAELASPTGQKKLEGEAEVEIERKNGVATKDELELEVEHLPAMTTCEVFIDGTRVGSFVTSKSGKAKLKFERDLNN
jgi:hypothetical protein